MSAKKHKKYIIFFLTFFIITLVLGSAVIYAKYHTMQAQKGVAVASEMYFSSNYLEKSPDNEYVTKYNTDKWEGDQSLFRIQLRNYENKFLYNKNVELICEVTVQLDNDPKEGFSYVVYDPKNHETKELTHASQSIKLSDIKIPYGQADEVEIDLGIIKDPRIVTDNTDSDEVIVTAIIVSPEYATNLGPLKAKLKVTTSNEVFSYEGKFKIANELNDSNLAEKIDYASGFVYIVNTSGGTENDDVELRISWDRELLKLNEFDELFYTDQIKKSEDNTKSYIDFYPKLNAHREIIFFKTDQFTSSKIESKTEFEGLVTIENIK